MTSIIDLDRPRRLSTGELYSAINVDHPFATLLRLLIDVDPRPIFHSRAITYCQGSDRLTRATSFAWRRMRANDQLRCAGWEVQVTGPKVGLHELSEGDYAQVQRRFEERSSRAQLRGA